MRWSAWHIAAALALGLAVTAGLVLWQGDRNKHRLQQAATVAGDSVDSPDATPPVAGRVGGPFTLTDQDGRQVSDADFPGKYLLIYFGYTSCPDMCPNGLQAMGDALGLLKGDADKVQILFVSVDPARDTPQKLKDFDRSYSPALIGLTGSPDQIAQVAKEYQVYYKKGEGDQDYAVDHSTLIYLVGPDRRLIRTFDEDADPDEIAGAVHDALGSGK